MIAKKNQDYYGLSGSNPGERFPNKKDSSARRTFYNLRVEKADLAPVESSASKDPIHEQELRGTF